MFHSENDESSFYLSISKPSSPSLIYLSICLSIYPSTYLSTCLPIYRSNYYLSIWIYPSIHPSIHQSIHPSIHPSIHLFIYPLRQTHSIPSIRSIVSTYLTSCPSNCQKAWYILIYTLPNTNSWPLKIGHPKRNFIFQRFQGHAVSFREGSSPSRKKETTEPSNMQHSEYLRLMDRQ